MAIPPKAPIHGAPFISRMRPAVLTVGSIVVFSSVLWGIMVAFKRFPKLAEWELPLGIGSAAILALVILWKVPQWQLRAVIGLEPKERFDRINEARKTLAQIVGGVALLAGLYSTAQSLKVARDSQVIAQNSFVLAEEGQITDRFTKAVEQLDARDSNQKKKIEIRLGGIYALERIANESKEEHWPVMEILTAYLRHNSAMGSRQGKPSFPPEMPLYVKPDTDTQAVLTVLKHRNVTFEEEGQYLDLTEVDISLTDLTEADFRNADFTKSSLNVTSLLRANLSKTDFKMATLVGANLDGADLTGASLWNANLSQAHFDQTNLQDADLTLADLSAADLTNARNLTQPQLDKGTRGNQYTRLPPNLHTPNEWRVKQ